MAHIVYDGEKIELAEDWRIGELIRAENELDLDMDTARTGGKTAIVLYISMARLERWQPGSPGNRGLADLVMRMELTELADDEEEAEAGPPAEGPAPDPGDAGKDSDDEDPPISGLRLTGS